MKSEEFDKIVEERLNKTREVLVIKAKEYASDSNRMHNFDRGASMSGQSREKVLWGFALKHYISFMDILDKIDKGELPSEALIDEKVGDLINYMILCEASIKDKIITASKP